MLGSHFYYLHPLLAGPIEAWSRQLDRVAAMQFDAVVIAPPFATGQSGDLFLTANLGRLDPRLGSGSAIAALARLCAECRDRQLQLILDVVVDRISAEQDGRNSLSAWYRADPSDELPDPRQPPHGRGVATISANGSASGLAEWWGKRISEWSDAGIAGFRCIRPHKIPAELWRRLIAIVRERHPNAAFLAATLGPEASEAEILAQCGFDLAGCCSRGWDYRADGFADAADRLARIAPLMTMPEAPFYPRLSRAYTDAGRARRASHRALAFSAAYGAGWLIPMGFEYGASRNMDAARDRAEDFDLLVRAAPFDLTEEITAANARGAADHFVATSLRSMLPPDAAAAALLLTNGLSGNAGDRARFVLANASLDDPVRVPLAPLLTRSGLEGALLDDEMSRGPPLGPDSTVTIPPGHVRTLKAIATRPVSRSSLDPIEAAAAPRSRDRGSRASGRWRTLSCEAADRRNRRGLGRRDNGWP